MTPDNGLPSQRERDVIWLRRKVGWLVCLTGGLAMVAAVFVAMGLFPSITIDGSPWPGLTLVPLVGGGLYLAKLGTVMCRD